jgi:hypothetical protein
MKAPNKSFNQYFLLANGFISSVVSAILIYQLRVNQGRSPWFLLLWLLLLVISGVGILQPYWQLLFSDSSGVWKSVPSFEKKQIERKAQLPEVLQRLVNEIEKGIRKKAKFCPFVVYDGTGFVNVSSKASVAIYITPDLIPVVLFFTKGRRSAFAVIGIEPDTESLESLQELMDNTERKLP